MNRRELQELDRYITGNWGEDSVSDDCCSDNLPEHSGFRQDDDRYKCPECHKEWVWVEDEAEGGYWAEAELL